MAVARLTWPMTFLVPGGAILALAVALLRPQGLPQWLHPVFTLLPALAYVFGLILGWSLDRARTVMAMLFLVAADRAIGFFPPGASGIDSTGQIVFALVAILLPINLLMLSVLGERGLLSRTTYIPLGLLLAEITFTWWVSRPGQQELAAALMEPAVNPGWTAWSPLPQPALFAFTAALFILVFQFALSPTVVSSSAIWALLAAFIALHGSTVGWAPSSFFGTAAIILCSAGVSAHYRRTYRDELTGIHGHVALDRALANLGRRYAIAILDIDRLREVNETYSEAIGDMVLQQVASVLASASGGGKAFRYSGEEFAILFPGRSSGEALVSMEQLRKQIEQAQIQAPARVRSHQRSGSKRVRPPSSTVSVTASIGIADSFDHPTNASDVIRAAYRGLALAKLDGGNRVTRVQHEEPAGRALAGARRA